MGLWDKVLGLLGVRGDEPEYEEEESEEGGQDGPDYEEAPATLDPAKVRAASEAAGRWGTGRRGQLVSMPGQPQLKLMVLEPLSFDEVQSVADHVKARRPAVVRLDRVDREQAQRTVDFLSGTAYALDGKMQRVGDGIFVIVPSNVSIEADARLELRQARAQTAATGSPASVGGGAGVPGATAGGVRGGKAEAERVSLHDLITPAPSSHRGGVRSGANQERSL